LLEGLSIFEILYVLPNLGNKAVAMDVNRFHTLARNHNYAALRLAAGLLETAGRIRKPAVYEHNPHRCACQIFQEFSATGHTYSTGDLISRCQLFHLNRLVNVQES
jgi:hypothetical protein